MRRGSAIALGLLLLLLSIACTDTADQEEQIRRSNEAAAVPSAIATSDEQLGTLSVFDLRVGDCFASRALSEDASGIVVEDVARHPCASEEAVFVVISSFLIEQDGPFPGDSYLSDLANEGCDVNQSWFLFPQPGSWELGDRAITCLTELDELERVDVPTCLTSEGGLSVNAAFQVACDQPHALEVYFTTDHPDAAAYPGDVALVDFAAE